jgi:VanZ family protein
VTALSFDVGSGERTGSMLGPLLQRLLPWADPLQIEAVHFAIRKAAHVTVYAVLAALWYRFFARGQGWTTRASALAAFAIAVAWAVLDEVHQAFTPSRTGAAMDVGIDAIGAALAVSIAALGPAAFLDRATGVLLWFAAVGGGAAVAIDAVVGVRSPALWIAVPAAIALLVLRRRAATAAVRPSGAGRAYRGGRRRRG